MHIREQKNSPIHY